MGRVAKLAFPELEKIIRSDDPRVILSLMRRGSQPRTPKEEALPAWPDSASGGDLFLSPLDVPSSASASDAEDTTVKR